MDTSLVAKSRRRTENALICRDPRDHAYEQAVVLFVGDHGGALSWFTKCLPNVSSPGRLES